MELQPAAALEVRSAISSSILGTLPGDTESLPYGLNEAGQVIGRSDPNIMGPFRGFIWELGQMKAVNGGVTPASNGSTQTTGRP